MNRCLAVKRSRNRLAFRTASSSDGFHHIRTPAPVKTNASGPYKLPSHDSSPARRTTVKQEKMAFWGPRLPSNSKSADCQLRRSRSQVGEITLRAFQKHDANQAVGRPWTLEKNGGNFIPRSMMSKPPYGGAKPERASAGIFYRLSSHSFISNAVHVAHPRQPISGKPSRLFSAFSQKFSLLRQQGLLSWNASVSPHNATIRVKKSPSWASTEHTNVLVWERDWDYDK
jgi:hypothetical protein